MNKKINKIMLLFIVVSLFLISTGCSSSLNKTNSKSPLANIKKVMVNNLENFSYDVTITVKTGFIDATTTMNCKEDRKNEVGYCLTSTYGVQTEQYIDYKNKINYSKVYSPYSNDSENGIWKKNKIDTSNTNNWLDLGDYIFDIKEESKNGGTYYTGIIDSKKLISALSSVDSKIDMESIVSDDIDISVFVNSSGYVERMTFNIEIMGMDEYVEIEYKDYNSSETIVIPSEVKG